MGLLEGRVRHCVIRIIQFKEHNDHAVLVKGRRLPFRMENGPLQICALSNSMGGILCSGTRVADSAPDISQDTLFTTIEFSLHLLSFTGTVHRVDLKPPNSVGPRVLPSWSTKSPLRISSTIWAPAKTGESSMLPDEFQDKEILGIVLRISNFDGRSRIFDQCCSGTSNVMMTAITRKSTCANADCTSLSLPYTAGSLVGHLILLLDSMMFS